MDNMAVGLLIFAFVVLFGVIVLWRFFDWIWLHTVISVIAAIVLIVAIVRAAGGLGAPMNVGNAAESTVEVIATAEARASALETQVAQLLENPPQAPPLVVVQPTTAPIVIVQPTAAPAITVLPAPTVAAQEVAALVECHAEPGVELLSVSSIPLGENEYIHAASFGTTETGSTENNAIVDGPGTVTWSGITFGQAFKYVGNCTREYVEGQMNNHIARRPAGKVNVIGQEDNFQVAN